MNRRARLAAFTCAIITTVSVTSMTPSPQSYAHAGPPIRITVGRQYNGYGQGYYGGYGQGYRGRNSQGYGGGYGRGNSYSHGSGYRSGYSGLRTP